jgi:hypothetical protein
LFSKGFDCFKTGIYTKQTRFYGFLFARWKAAANIFLIFLKAASNLFATFCIYAFE